MRRRTAPRRTSLMRRRRWWWSSSATLLLLLSAATTNVSAAAIDARQLRFLDDDAPRAVLIGYKPQQAGGGNDASAANTLSLAGATPTSGEGASSSSSTTRNDPRLSGSEALDRVSAKKANLTRSEVQDLLDNDPDILYVEEDSVVHMLAVEVTPYGIETVRANSAQYPPPVTDTGIGAPCSDPSSFKIGIVDSGLDVSHPDIPCYNTGDTSQANCVGQVFGVTLSGDWSAPDDIHGTFVSGIIAAIRGNNLGVTGVLNNDNVCIIMGRVFAADGAAMLSDVLDAVQWVADQGADVLNLSLGGPTYSETAKAIYQSIRDDNKLVFCASGNDGKSELFYPASYSSTVSVGAIDSSLAVASFSQFNSEVDLVAPGVSILSTAPSGFGTLYLVQVGANEAPLLPVRESPSPPSQITGTLVVCTNLGQDTCAASGGQICLIERGTNTFEEKALNCMTGGGAAAIIYNNGDGFFRGTLRSPTQVTIPVFALDGATGQALAQLAGNSITLYSEDGYAVADGTSFASPHAAGAAAAVWQACRSCTNDQVLSCLLDTARDLGTSGRDDYYGNGLVQVDEAYLCLVQTVGCCTPGSPTAVTPTSPSPAVTTEPTPAISMEPTPSPVDSPTFSGDCQTLEQAYQDCFLTDFTSASAFDACRDCVNDALSGLGTAETCDAVSAGVCSATRVTCDCSTCTDVIESYLSCSLQASTTCPALDCASYQPNHNNTSIGDISGAVCADKRFQLESCALLSTTEEGLVSPQQQQDGSDCSACLTGSLPRSFAGSTCDEINQNFACPGIDQCTSVCSPQCQEQVTEFMDCLVTSNSQGCVLGCNWSSSTNGNVFDSTSSSVRWHAVNSGMRILLGAFGALMMLVL